MHIDQVTVLIQFVEATWRRMFRAMPFRARSHTAFTFHLRPAAHRFGQHCSAGRTIRAACRPRGDRLRR